MIFFGYGSRGDKIALNALTIVGILAVGAIGFAMLLSVARDGGAVSANQEDAAGAIDVVFDEAVYGAPFYGAGGQRGIWVTGSASVSVEPDIATLNVGVSARGATVAAANAEATAAMEAALGALRGSGVADRDIQTRNFSVYPRYEYRDTAQRGGGVISKQLLTGYEVNNDISAKIRDIDVVGETIDAVIAAAGDSARINGVSFGMDDVDALRPELRRMAVADAIARAEVLAELAGVELGRLLYMSEGAGAAIGGGYGYGGSAYALEAASAAPPISAGEHEVRFSVSAGFGIR